MPGIPEIRTEDCKSLLNTFTVSWRPSGPVAAVDGYSVEIAENGFNSFRVRCCNHKSTVNNMNPDMYQLVFY